MMSDKELNNYALELANMSLENGFDENAYILKILAENAIKNENTKFDTIPESTVDERIEELMNDFIYYFNSKDLKALQKVMKTIRRIISEIYHSANTREERDIILHELQVMQVIK